jgi:hypothetical protein
MYFNTLLHLNHLTGVNVCVISWCERCEREAATTPAEAVTLRVCHGTKWRF